MACVKAGFALNDVKTQHSSWITYMCIWHDQLLVKDICDACGTNPVAFLADLFLISYRKFPLVEWWRYS